MNLSRLMNVIILLLPGQDTRSVVVVICYKMFENYFPNLIFHVVVYGYLKIKINTF